MLSTKKITACALFSAIICVVTTFVAIPAPTIGNINVGDIFILCCAWLISPPYCAIAAGLGAGLADIFSGYAIYAPATFIIKFCMALMCHYIFSLLSKCFKRSLFARILSAFVAEAVMVLGYFVYECIIYDPTSAFASIPFNLIQGSVCLVVGVFVCQICLQNKALESLSEKLNN